MLVVKDPEAFAPSVMVLITVAGDVFAFVSVTVPVGFGDVSAVGATDAVKVMLDPGSAGDGVMVNLVATGPSSLESLAK